MYHLLFNFVYKNKVNIVNMVITINKINMIKKQTEAIYGTKLKNSHIASRVRI